MKLRTEMQDGCVHVDGCCIDEYEVTALQAETLELDAACAHALMQAMESIPRRYREWVEIRADGIMAGWGFDSGEVE